MLYIFHKLLFLFQIEHKQNIRCWNWDINHFIKKFGHFEFGGRKASQESWTQGQQKTGKVIAAKSKTTIWLKDTHWFG